MTSSYTRGLIALAIMTCGPVLLPTGGGDLEVALIGSDGAPLEGVLVIATSPARMRAWTAVSSDGGARFRDLPPGRYRVEAMLLGQGAAVRTEVQVSSRQAHAVAMTVPAARRLRADQAAATAAPLTCARRTTRTPAPFAGPRIGVPFPTLSNLRWSTARITGYVERETVDEGLRGSLPRQV